MSPIVYLTLDIGTLGLFFLTCLHAWRRGRPVLWELVTAAVFGLLLEWADIRLFGTYTYSRGFFLRIGPVPLTIAWCWSMLIYGAMLYSDRLGLSGRLAPFADAVWTIMLDLAFDAVAIRMGFWRWNIPLHDGYFGVPAGNFNAWLYVALGFSLVTRWVRGRPKRVLWQGLVPFAAFLVLLGGIYLFDGLVWWLYPHTPGDKGMAIFVVTLALFSALTMPAVLKRRPLAPVFDLLPALTRLLMHGYFGAWLVVWLVVPSTRQPGVDASWFLLGVAFVLLLLDLALLALAVPWNSAVTNLAGKGRSRPQGSLS